MTQKNPYEPPSTTSSERLKINENVPSKVDDAREWVSLLSVILIVAALSVATIATAALIRSSGWKFGGWGAVVPHSSTR